jgi:acyl-CoA thioester hydrolase
MNPHEKTIEIRWRDLDAFGHVNNGVYLTYLEEVRDEWLARALGPDAGWGFVLARVAIDFRHELREADDYVNVTCRLERLTRSNIVTREEVRTTGGELSAEAESVLVAREESTGRSRPLTEPERERLEATLSPAARPG